MINKERKHFQLKAMSRSPKHRHELVSNTCLVQDGEEVGYCYIRFSESFVTFVGMKLPQGVAPFNPAIIEVQRLGDIWEVRATYHLTGASATLWKADVRPSWIGKLTKGKSNGNGTQSATAHPGITAAAGIAGSATGSTCTPSDTHHTATGVDPGSPG